MREILTFILRTGLFSAGVLLFYASLSNETEEGKIQNLLEEWWIKVDDYQRQALSKHIAFLKLLGSVSTRVFDQLFGPSLLSVQAIGVSLCLCSVCIGVLSLIIGRVSPRPELSATSSLWIVFSSSAYGIIPAFLQRIPRQRLRVSSVYLWFVVLVISQLWGIDLVMFLAFAIALLDPKLRLGAVVILGFIACLVAAVALFVLLVVLMRKTVRTISRSHSAMRIISMSALNILPPVVLIGMIVSAIYMPDWFGRTGTVLFVVFILVGIFGLVVNFPFFLSALMFVLIAITMFVHRLFWPAISRPLYKLQAMGVAKRPLLFRAISLLLVSASIGWHQWIWFVVSKL